MLGRLGDTNLKFPLASGRHVAPPTAAALNCARLADHGYGVQGHSSVILSLYALVFPSFSCPLLPWFLVKGQRP